MKGEAATSTVCKSPLTFPRATSTGAPFPYTINVNLVSNAFRSPQRRGSVASESSTFRQSAVISGLLTAEQIATVDATLSAGAAGSATVVSDEALVARLIELGHLNRWQAEQLKVGRTKFNLGPYLVVDSIGQGGMGQVFKAEHRMMGRTVAIKVLPRHKSTPEAIASFTREIRAQAQLDHPNLVRAFDAGHEGNVYFLVTEYVPGTDLRKFVRARGRLTQTEAATIISQAAAGLDHAHRRGLIHRDVKPGNLLVTPDGLTKVSDLGLAGFLDQDIDAEDPRAGKIVGTADYLSPEQIINPRSVTAAGDLYSLGCTLYYAVTGKVPFPGGNTRDKARRHCEDVPLNPRVFNPALSDEFIKVMEAMMEKSVADRLQSGADVVARLAPWAGESVTTRPDERGAGGGHPFAAENARELFGDSALGANGNTVSKSVRDSRVQPVETVEPPNHAAEAPLSIPLVLFALGPVFLAAGLLIAALFLVARL